MPAGFRAEEKRYLREVERHFLRRRGHPLLISPREWALALAWFEEGIPLSIVFAGIDTVFDRVGETPSRRPRTLAYCARAVEAIWHERCSRTVPAAAEPPRERAEDRFRLAALVEEAAGRLREAGAAFEGGSDPFGGERRALESAALELRAGSDPLAAVESAIARADVAVGTALLAACPAAEREEAAREAGERLAPHRPHMTSAAWKRTLERAIENRLRERHGLPRLSLMLV